MNVDGLDASKPASSRWRSRPEWMNSALSISLLFVCFSSALCFGSVDRWYQAIWLLALSPLALVAVWMSDKKLLAAAAAVGLVASCFAAVAVLQVLNPPVVGSVHPIWADVGRILGKTLPGQVSIVRNEPLFALGNVFAGAVAIIVGIAIGREEAAARRFLRRFAVIGSAYAALSIFWFFALPGMLLWRQKTAYFDDLTGTFINRNTAAAFFAMVSIVLMTELASRLQVLKSRGMRGLNFLVRDRNSIFYTTLLAVSSLALLLTNSRAGTLIGVTCATSAMLLISLRGSRKRYLVRYLAIVLVAFALLLVGSQLTSVGGRLSDVGFTSEGRFDTYVSTFNLIRSEPMLGYGLGSYKWAYPPFRGPTSIGGVVDRAHSTVLEIAAEGGVPLALLVTAAWLTAILAVGYAAYKRRRSTLIAPFMVMLAGHVHSLIDFPLQIPGFAISFCAITGIGIGRAVAEGKQDLRRSDLSV